MQLDIEKPKTRKKACNVRISEDLLIQARDAEINISQTLEIALKEAVKLHQQQTWRKENQKAIESMNKRIENHGTFAEQEGLI